MSAHTVGPWQVKSEFEPEYIVGDIDGPDDGTMYYQPVAMVMETKNFEANARLIAAAPELLAALKELVAAGDNTVASDDGVAAMIRFGEADDAARALIAKAEAA